MFIFWNCILVGKLETNFGTWDQLFCVLKLTSWRIRSFIFVFKLKILHFISTIDFALQTPKEKCPYSELFWFVFSCIRTESREIFRRDIPYLSVFSPNAGEGLFCIRKLWFTFLLSLHLLSVAQNCSFAFWNHQPTFPNQIFAFSNWTSVYLVVTFKTVLLVCKKWHSVKLPLKVNKSVYIA